MTGCDRVLQLLSDGKPHDHHEIYALRVIGHSRISELRKRGHAIVQWRENDLYLYQLVSSTGSPSIPGEPRDGSRAKAHHRTGGGGLPVDHTAAALPSGGADLSVSAHVLVAAEGAARVGEDDVNDLERRASSPTQLSLLVGA